MKDHSNSCFVIMPIDYKRGDYEDLYKNHLRRLIEHELMSVSCIRADEIFNATEPKHLLIQRVIKECTFAIADISEKNPNVYYEIGYAQAIGKTVILIKNKHIGKLPFDIQSLNVLIYDKDKVEYNDISKQILTTLEEENLGRLIKRTKNETIVEEQRQNEIVGNWRGCYWVNNNKHTVRLYIDVDEGEGYVAVCLIDIERDHKRYRIRETLRYNYNLKGMEWRDGEWVEFIGTTYFNELNDRLDYWMDAYAINKKTCGSSLHIKIWDNVNREKQDVLFERFS